MTSITDSANSAMNAMKDQVMGSTMPNVPKLRGGKRRGRKSAKKSKKGGKRSKKSRKSRK